MTHLLLRPLFAATLALSASAQNWVGFGDNAWPGAPLSSRGTIAPAGAGELMVRLDAWEHGGWGFDPAFPGTRTIDAVQFYAHTLRPATTITLLLYNEVAPHFPAAVGAVLSCCVPIAVSPVPVLHVATFPPVRVACTGTGDLFVSFQLAALDGVQIGIIDTTTDTPGARYTPKPFGYPGPVTPSHCYSKPTIPPVPLPGYLPGPAQFFVDVAHDPSLASGVGGAVTAQPTLLVSGVVPGTSDFLSGSFPDCTGTLGGRALTPDTATMKIRPPLLCPPAPGSVALFVLASGRITLCGSELAMMGLFPGVCTSGALCIDPATIFSEVVLPMALFGDTVITYPLVPAYLGLGATHQAFLFDPFAYSIHAGPCDRMDL